MKLNILIMALFISVGSMAQEHDAVFKLLKKEYQLHNDGSIEYTYTKELKLHSKYAFNRMYGESFVVYNPDFQRLKIEAAYTIMADGKRVDCPKNAFNEVLPRAAAGYPAYNNMRELVITHTALEPGCTIFLKYTLVSSPQHIDQMMGTEVWQEEVPVEKAEFVLKVPARRNLQCLLLNSDVVSHETLGDSERSYTWTFKNLKASTHEAHAPAYGIAPTIFFSTYADLPTALESWAKINKIGQGDLKSMPALANSIALAQKQGKSGFALARDIQKIIVNDIDNKPIPLAWHNFMSEGAAKAWQSGVGSGLDKARLLCHALQAAGFSAQLVAFVPRALWQSQIGDLNALHKFGVRISSKSMGDMVLSATQLNTQSLDLALPTYAMVALPSAKLIAPPQADMAVKMHADITLDLGQYIRAELQWKAVGAMNKNMAYLTDAAQAMSAITPAWEAEKAKKSSRFVADANTTEVNCVAMQKAAVKQEGDYYFWQMPQYKYGVASAHYMPMLSARDEAMVVPAYIESYTYDIELPKSVSWLQKEVKIDRTESFGEMHIHIRFEKGKVRVSKLLQIYPEAIDIKVSSSSKRRAPATQKYNYRYITVEAYPAFRQMMIDWFSDKANVLVFKRP